VLPYFKRLERRIGEGEDAFRGRDGSLTVTTMDWRDPLCEAFMAGAISLGIPRNPDYNGAIQEGVSYAQRTIQNGRRVSAATAFLRPAMKRPNVDVRTHAHATGILFEGKRAVGVRYVKGGKGGHAVEVRANKEVILAGGAYNSPQLLQLSGVGSPELLGSLGIEVRHALPGVGEGLQDHYAPRSVARVKNIKTINELRRGLSLWVEALKWATTRRGLLSLSPTMVYCFWHSGETTESSDLQLTFTPASYKEGVQGQLEDEPGMTVASWQQRPESRGYVRIRSADPFLPPIIQTNYLVAELDRRVVVAGMKLARRLLASAPLAPYYDHEDFPGPGVQSDDEFLHAATLRGTTTFHPGCTCRMGPADAAWAVVDDQLRVHGLQNLRVVDASIMPRMISANLNASTLMIADKASDMIRGRKPLEAAELRDARRLS
jgi:choline dehydrogenase